MHDFAVLAMIGLAVFAVVDGVDHALFRRMFPRYTWPMRALLALVLGMAFTWMTDYTVFASWGIPLRSLWMGPVATGLMIGGAGMAWRETFNFIGSYARRSRDEAAEIESRITEVRPRAA